MRIWTLTTAFLALACLVAADRLAAAEPPDGEALVQQVWRLMKANDQAELAALMAPGFQAVHDHGAVGKDGELALIGQLALGEYRLSEFKTTMAGDVIVVTYRVSVAETIDGKRLDKAPAMRLSVFVKADGAWRWAAHANLKPVP